VCNHPDLFEGRPIVSAFDSPPLVVGVPSRVMVGCTSPPLDQELGWLVNQVREPGREGGREGGSQGIIGGGHEGTSHAIGSC
jgi:hypothetical protein